ncbi:MAG: hypothetical protein WAT79_06875 [Saprospiraceae bacterium]
MKSFYLFFTYTFVLLISSLSAQEIVMEKSIDSMIINKTCCDTVICKPKPWVTAEYRTYNNPAKSTVKELSSAGFLLDEHGTEIGIKFGQFPKIFYYQQLGSLENTNYSSIYGIGLKEKYQYDFIKNPAIVLAPYLEVGAGFYFLSLVKNVNNNSYTSPNNNLLSQSKFENFSITGDLGLSIGYEFNLGNTSIGITGNGGYMTNLPSNWKTGHSLAFKEKVDLSSVYYGVRLSIGLSNCCCCCM